MRTCPHCHKEIEEKDDSFHSFQNILVYALPVAITMTLLDKYTNIPLSVADGLSWNLYFLPALILFPIILIYYLLYKGKKVKGKFLPFK